uniref:VeG51P n=1 Tax=Conus vexillum TaxID=89431 RepID=Q3YEF6_CONVX|nr:VeG51P [Conus vexillum]DAZ86238.1 TPA_inf: conotoxin precursor O2 [Conus ebraeus]
MEKLAILLLAAAILMLTQALIQDGEKHQRMKTHFLSKRKSVVESWWEGECSGWSVYCVNDWECCSGECGGSYCELW